MWTQPHLNTQLFLNYKGFMCIEGLEDYVNVRALHLDNNNIGKIEGLDRMSDLRTLHLGGNRITSIENLEANTELRHLDLQGNGVRCVSGLQSLVKLETLNLSANNLESIDDLTGLQEAPSLHNVDVSQNNIETSEGVVEFWSKLKQINLLRYHGNPGIRHVQHYRKRLINSLPQLSYLDERPVFPVERRSCAAWAEGGMSAMHQAKKDFHRERNEECRVEESRKEMLTRRRQMAIERMDREAREREERERQAEAEATKSGTANAAHSGDQDALDDYAKSWRTQMSLYGADGVRAKVAQEAGPGQRAAMESIQSATQSVPAQRPHKPDFDFAPPSRGAADGAGSTGSAVSLSARSVSMLRGARENSKSLEAAEFKARIGDDHTLDTADRQFSVLGSDDWLASSSDTKANSNAASKEVVMPQMWADRAASAAQEEMAIMEQNFAIAEAMSHDKALGVQSTMQTSSCHDELQVLD